MSWWQDYHYLISDCPSLTPTKCVDNNVNVYARQWHLHTTICTIKTSVVITLGALIRTCTPEPAWKIWFLYWRESNTGPTYQTHTVLTTGPLRLINTNQSNNNPRGSKKRNCFFYSINRLILIQKRMSFSDEGWIWLYILCNYSIICKPIFMILFCWNGSTLIVVTFK